MADIDDILNDEPQDEAPAVENAEPVVVETAPEERPRDESGKFVAKETGVSEAEASPVPPTAESGLPPAEYAALRDERKKRQSLEARLAELEAKQVPPPAPNPSVFEDEEGFQQGFGSQVIQQAVGQATLNARLDMSEMLARQAHGDDFEQMKETFLSLANENPALAEQARNDPHPWDRAYSIAKNHVAMKELAAVDVADLETKLRAKIMAEMGQQPAPVVRSIPQTLSNEQNVGSRAVPQWSGQKSLSELLS